MHTRTALQRCSIERRPGKPARRPARAPTPAVVTFAASLSLGASTLAVASPTGGVVTQGQGSISTPASGQTLVNQSSQQLQLNWSTFNVAANESVRFKQPSSTAIAFNRILDQNPSQIFGTLSANGQVVLVNPNGVLIGRTAQLNVNSLVVSSLNAIDFDAASGRYRFSATRSDPGAVVNQGTITAQPGGSITLLGGSVSNTGTIVADYGTVNLAAGRTATLDLAGDGLLRLEVGADLLTNHDGAASAVENSGAIEANGGHVLLTASAVKDVFQNLVNNSGVIRANRIANSGGTIELLGPGGTVVSSGMLDASAGDAVSTGGTVEVLGDRVGLTRNAVVDVSGATGGGTALVGGDTHGTNPDVLDASTTYVSAGATLNADAGEQGDGGRVVVWSNDTTSYGGSLSARGGTTSGDGGFAEVSGKGLLQFSGTANLTAPHGVWGMLLLDPVDITINASAATPSDWPTPPPGDPDYAPVASTSINVSDIKSLLSTTSLTLTADHDITETPGLAGAGATIDVSAISGAAGNSLTLNAGRNINLSYPIATNNGAISLTAGTGNVNMLSGSSLDAGTAAVTVSAGSGATITSILHAGTVSVNSGASTSPTGSNNDLTLGSITSTSDVSLTANRGGSILESATGPGAGIQILGGTGVVTLSADADIGTVTNFASLAGTPLPVQGANSLTADVTGAAGGQVNLLLSNTILNSHAIQFTGTNTAGGPIILQTQGSFDTTDTTFYRADAIDVPSTGTSEVALVSQQGTLTVLNSLPDLINGTPGTLLLSGSDVVSNDLATPHQIAINLGSSGDLIFDASAPAADVILNTTAGHVSAIVGNTRSLTVNNAGALTLDAASAGGTVTVSTTGGGNLDVHGPVSATFVNITPSGAITEDTAASIGAATLTATATAIGTQAAPLLTQVALLQTTSTNGGTYIQQTGTNTVQVQSSAAQGPLQIEAAGSILATSAGGKGVQLQADAVNGTLTVSNPIDAGTGNLTLEATGSGGSIALNAPVTAQGITTIAAGVNGNGALTLGNGVSADGSQLIVDALSIGTSGNFLQTLAGTVNATATSGSLFITDTTSASATLTASATGGSVRVETPIGALNVASASGTGVSLDTLGNGKALTVTGAIDAKTGAASLATVGSGSNIVLNGTLNGGGGVSVTTAGAGSSITLNDPITSQSPISLSTVGANADITLNSSVSTLQSVSIDAGSGPTQGAIVAGTNNSVSGSQITLSGSSIGSNAVRLATAAGTSLNVTGSNGSVYIQQAGSASLLASALGGSVNVATTNGTLTVQSANGNGVSLSAGGSTQSLIVDGNVDGEGTGVSLGSAGAITINAPINTASQVTLNAGGAITAGLGDSITASGGLTLTGATIGTSAAQPLTTIVGTLNATSTGDAFIGNTGALTLTGNSGSGTLNVKTSGALAVTSASGNQVTLQGTSIGGNGGTAAITSAASLNVTSTGGGIDVQQSNGMNLTANATGGSVNVVTTNGALTVSSATGNGIILTAGGAGHDLTVNGALDGEGTAVVLTAGGGINIDTPITTASALTLDATGAITAGAASDLITASALTANAASIGSSAGRLATNTASLDLTSNSGGIFITQSGDISLSASATGGALDVQTSNGALNALSAAGDGIRLVANGAGKTLTVNGALNGNNGDVTLEAAGDAGNVTLGGSVSTSGNVTIAAGSANSSGVLTVANGASVAGNQVNISGTSIGALGSALALATNALTVTSTNGGIFVSNSRDLSLNAAASGGDLDLATTGNLTVAAASTTGNVSLSATGSIGASPGATVTGNTVILQGSSIGASNNVLSTAAVTLDASSTNGGIYVQQDNNLSLTANATGGPVNVATITGALTVLSASGDGVNLSSGAAGQDFNINGTVNGGTGPVVLTASGAGSSLTLSGALNASNNVSLNATGAGGAINLDAPISTAGGGVALVASGANGAVNLNAAVSATGNVSVDAIGLITAGAGSLVTANALQATGASIGTGTAALITAVGQISATSTNGGIFISNSGPLALTAMASGGPVDISTTGALSVASAVGDDVTLTATGLLSEVSAGTIEGNQVTLQATSIGTSSSPLSTVASSLNAMSTNGDIHVRQANGLTLTANATGGQVDVATANGALTVSSAIGNGVTLAAGGASQNLNVNGALDGGGSAVSLSAGGAINVNATINTASALTLGAAGAITAASGGQITASSLTATGTSIGAAGASLVTTVGALDAVTTSGGTFVSNSGPLALTARATGGPVDIATTGALTVNSVVADDVTLDSSGSLVTAGGGGIGGNHVILQAASIGASTSALSIAATSVNATSTSGGIYLQQANDLNLTANATGGPVDVATTNGALTVLSATGSGVTLSAAGAAHNLNVNGVLDGAGSLVSLTSSGAINFNAAINTTSSMVLSAAGAITAGAGDLLAASALTASASSIGTASNPLNTNVAALTTTSKNGGTYVNESNSVTLTASATGGSLDVRTANGALVVDAASAPTISLTAGGAGSGITLNGVVNAGTGDVTLSAGTTASPGAITAGVGNQVTAGTLTAQGASVGSSATALNTAINILNATASTGDIEINQQGDIKLASVQAGGNVGIGSSGNITVGAVSAHNNATLTAQSGTISSGGDANSQLSGNTVTLAARAIGAPSTLTGATLNSATRLNTEATNLVATSTAGGVYINQLTGLASADVHASGGKNGNIELLTTTGDLNIAGMSASGNLLLAAGGNIYALPGSGTITAQAAELRAGGADLNAGHIGTLSHPLVLQLNAGNTLRMFVPQTVNPNDANSGPATLTSPGVNTTLSLFTSPNLLAVEDGFGQFTGLGETQFTSPAELLVRSIQNQTATVQSVVGLDWSSFDPNVSLFGKLDPSVCLPGDQRDEEPGAPGAADRCAAR